MRTLHTDSRSNVQSAVMMLAAHCGSDYDHLHTTRIARLSEHSMFCWYYCVKMLCFLLRHVLSYVPRLLTDRLSVVLTTPAVADIVIASKNM